MAILYFVIALVAFLLITAIKSPWQKKERPHSQLHRGISRGIKVQQVKKQEVQLNKITQRDANFDLEHMISRVSKSCLAIKKAWSDHDLSQVSCFISDGVAQRYAIQFSIQKKHHRHRKLDDLTVSQCDLVGLEVDEHFETLHFKVHTMARHIIIDTRSPKPPKKLPSKLGNIEFWTFTRLPCAKTEHREGLLEGMCPNCGSSLLLNKYEQCQGCHSLVKSGEYDWMLIKITQNDEWRFQQAKRTVKGVAQYQVVDPYFNLSIIEDRVCVVFWRLQQAWLEKSTAALTSVAHPVYLEDFNDQLVDGQYFDHIELDLCEVVDVEFGQTLDKIIILVKWTAELVSVTDERGSDIKYFSHHLVLVRKKGISSDIKKGLHSLHCNGCGAPQTNVGDTHCQYCRRCLNQGDSDWVLRQFSPSLQRVVKLQGKAFSIDAEHSSARADIFDPVALLSCLVLMMLADGKIDIKEQQFLDDFVAKHGIPTIVLTELLTTAEQQKRELRYPDETLDATVWLIQMIEMCIADGEILQVELDLLLRFGEKFNMLALDIQIRIKKAQGRLLLKQQALKQQAKK